MPTMAVQEITRALVPESLLPSTARLVFVLPRIEVVAAQAVDEQKKREEGSNYFLAVAKHTPPLAQAIMNDLRITWSILQRAGSAGTNRSTSPQGEVHDTLNSIHRQLGSLSQDRFFLNPFHTRQTAQDLIHVLHPDTTGVADSFSHEERTRLFQLAINAYNENNPVDVQEIDWQVRPKYYLDLVRSLVAKGDSFDDIVGEYPELVPELERLYLTATDQFKPGEAWRRLVDPKTAEQRAATLKGHKDFHAFYLSGAQIYAAIAGMGEYCQESGLTNYLEKLESINAKLFESMVLCYKVAEFRAIIPYVATLSSTTEVAAQEVEKALRALPAWVFEVAHLATTDRIDERRVNAPVESLQKEVKLTLKKSEEYFKVFGRQVVPPNSLRSSRRTDAEDSLVFSLGLRSEKE